MDRLGLIGISWRQGGSDALARFTLPVEARPERLPRLAQRIEAEELVYLATCNRVEVALVTREGLPVAAYRPRLFSALSGRKPGPGEAERALRAWQGEGALEHLFLVAAGFDSARVGEREVAGQVRDAFELAQQLELTGPRLEMVFELALRVSRRVHRQTGLGRGHVSLAEIALESIRRRLGRTPGPVALFGVSPMTIRCARELATEGADLLIVNRTLVRAEKLAQEVNGRAMSLDDFRRRPAGAEILVLATSSRAPLLGRPELEKTAARTPSGEGPLIVDLAVPPDVAPQDAEAVGLRRVDMDEVIAEAEENRDRRLAEMAEARLIVDESMEEARRKLTERMLAPLIGALHRRYRHTAVEGAERLFRKQVPQLGEKERETIRRWAETLARRFAHVPVLGLRGLASDLGPDGIEAFLAGLDRFDRSLASELRDASHRPRQRQRSLEEVGS